MSLQVWLPLIKNLNNQGCGTATISAPSTTFTLQKGKIGNAAYTSSSTITVNLPSIASSRIWSVTFWAYAVSANITANWTRVIRIADGGDMFRVEVCPSSYNSGQNCYSTHNNAAYKIAQGSVSSQSGGYYDQWFHMAITCDGTTISVYHNGTLRGTQNYTGDGAITGYFYIENSDKTYKNDFRVYDECLSPKQVKEISKGLVVHYPMDGGGRGANNLVNGSNTNSVDTNGFGYSEQTGGSTRTIEYDGGIPCVKITRNTTAHSGWDYFWYNKFRISEIKVNTTYVVSFDAIGSGSGSIGLSGFINGNGTNSITESVTTVSNSFNANTWSHIQFITKTKSSFDDITVGSQVVYMSCSFLRTVSTWVKLKNMKVIEGSTESSWMPSVSDTAYTKMGYDNNTEYDISGFGNTATASGSISRVTDTPKYSCCTRFPTTTHIKYRCEITNMYHATYSMWVKFNTITAYGGFHMQYNNPSGGAVPWFAVNTEGASLWCYFGGNSPNYTKAGSADIQTNTWYHIVYVWNNGVAQWYLNGTRYGNSVTYTGKTYIQNNVDTSLGDSYTGSSWNGTPFDGWVSDFRLYATALSDADIKDLYQTSASIDNKGNIFCSDIQEV